MEAECSSKTNLYQTTRRHIPEDSTLYRHRRDNFKCTYDENTYLPVYSYFSLESTFSVLS
jgi:hypothetical protein